jgi:hypothetical protein
MLTDSKNFGLCSEILQERRIERPDRIEALGLPISSQSDIVDYLFKGECNDAISRRISKRYGRTNPLGRQSMSDG